MSVVLSVINKGELFIVKEINSKIIGYLVRNIDGLMVKSETSHGVEGLKYITFPKGYNLNVENGCIIIEFPQDHPKGSIKIFY